MMFKRAGEVVSDYLAEKFPFGVLKHMLETANLT